MATLAFAQADDGRVKGMTVSCPTWGWEWGSDDMVTTLDELAAIGVNWVAIHPYASIKGDGGVRFKPIDHDNPPAYLVRPIREAHARGIKILMKPHIAYWGSKFSWRGEITFEDEAERARFFTEYKAWIVDVAKATREADAFAVGTELDGTIAHTEEWRAVIASVREVHPGSLTYASNWTDYGKVEFWDDLDAIGVQAYFPVTDGWDPIMKDVGALSKKTGKPVVFTELGYSRNPDAAARPWDHVDRADGADEQERCMREALAAIDAEPAVVGAFLWKWFPGKTEPRNFSMERGPVQQIIEERWGE